MTEIKMKKRCNLVDGGEPCKNCTPAALVEKLRARVAELETAVEKIREKLIIEGPDHLITAIEDCDEALAGRKETA